MCTMCLPLLPSHVRMILIFKMTNIEQMLCSSVMNYEPIFVILVTIRKLSQLRLHCHILFIPCGAYVMSILISRKSQKNKKNLCPHISSSTCYHGNLKACNCYMGEGKGWLHKVNWENMDLTPNQVEKTEVRAPCTSHVLSS